MHNILYEFKTHYIIRPPFRLCIMCSIYESRHVPLMLKFAHFCTVHFILLISFFFHFKLKIQYISNSSYQASSMMVVRWFRLIFNHWVDHELFCIQSILESNVCPTAKACEMHIIMLVMWLANRESSPSSKMLRLESQRVICVLFFWHLNDVTRTRQPYIFNYTL